jgi:hypothetical protein
MKGIALAILFVTALFSLPHGVNAEAAPSLVLSSVTISPAEVMVGGSFESEMMVVNVGSLVALTAELNFDLVSISGRPFSITSSGTLLNIGELAPGANMTLRASFAVSFQGTTGTYDVPYRLTYSDENKYSYTKSGTFGIVLRGVPDLEIQYLTVDPAKLTPTVDGTLSISFINIGTELAKDVTVRIYNDGGLLTSTVGYVGELDRGAVKTVAFGIHVDEAPAIGTRLANLTLTYTDPSGNFYTSRKICELRVYPYEPLIPSYDYPFIAGAVLFTVLFYIALRRLGHGLW